MRKEKKKKEVFRSLNEFERKYFPKSFKKKMKEKPSDARELGINLAKESLEKIKRKLSQQ